ncbi:hypothetical protein GCM10023209_18080 [Roseibacterium beibuensis]|uniref:Uncharacterized protein n=1 Tax=[Roseibacterium] beibuensis TaxID=1193142 RepID=A0ABP9L7S2_9RHOB
MTVPPHTVTYGLGAVTGLGLSVLAYAIRLGRRQARDALG